MDHNCDCRKPHSLITQKSYEEAVERAEGVTDRDAILSLQRAVMTLQQIAMEKPKDDWKEAYGALITVVRSRAEAPHWKPKENFLDDLRELQKRFL